MQNCLTERVNENRNKGKEQPVTLKLTILRKLSKRRILYAEIH